MSNGKLPFLDKLKGNPKQIFLIDAVGAILTTVMLLGVLVPLEQYFGMPVRILHILSGIAFCIFTFSTYCYFFIKSNRKSFLGIIIACNILYSLATIVLIYKFSEKLTELGVIYFVLELIVLGILVTIEYKTYSNFLHR